MNPVQASYPEKSKVDTDDLTPTDLLEMRDKLQDELQELLIAGSTVTQESLPGDVQELHQRVQAMQEQLLEASNKSSVNELLLKRIQMGSVLSDVMFSESVNQDNNAVIKRSLEELDLASQIKRIHRETAELQEKVENQKLANARLRKENLEMMKKLNSNMEKTQEISAEVANNKEYKKLKSELEVKSMSLDIHKNLIQLIIMGMGEDWSQNPELNSIMLQCEESLNL